MRATKVLLIESAHKEGEVFAASLMRKYEVQIANTGKQGLELAAKGLPDVVVLNAVSMRTSGDRIAVRLRTKLGELPLIHIRPEEAKGDEIVADVVLTPPFTSRKLINRIERYVPPAENELLEVGPFKLSVEQQTLTTPWSEKKLTPKLVELMQLFLSNQDQTLERKQIIQAVWKTDYMGDTRTLDVHIRWLRKVVEPQPRKPKYITTVRGVGYCFRLPDEASASEADEAEKTSSTAASGKQSSKQRKSKSNSRPKKSTQASPKTDAAAFAKPEEAGSKPVAAAEPGE